ncbi:MAG: lactate racemase domain-containing protein [Anaerovoracaceae bacterium]|jgi:nickel-dependent lactate racemase
MKYNLPANNLYGDAPILIDFPENWDVTISKFEGYEKRPLSDSELDEAVRHPIGGLPISEGAKGKKSAVIIIDDITRPTPLEAVSRAVIRELLKAGVPRENIWFIAALGAHGVMYREQFIRKLGTELVETFEIHNHNAFFNHVFVGNTSNNVPVEINADVMSADYRISIGTTLAHCFYGFSGGAKSILPGVASLRTICANHSFTTFHDFDLGNPDALMRRDAQEAAHMVGLDFRVDVLLNGYGQICDVFAGDLDTVSEKSAERAGSHYRARFIPNCDIVLANNYFKPSEANTACTPEVKASMKDGGSFILAANSPLGPCVHFLYDKWGHSSPGGLMWAGCYTKEPRMKHAVVFAQHTLKGMNDACYLDEKSGAVYAKTWDEVLRIVDDGLPKKVAVYPNAECQILTE